MTTDNKAILTIMGQQIKEYNELLIQHNALLVVHTKTVNEFADKCIAFDEMKKTNRALSKLLNQWEKENEELIKIIFQWEKENGILQESLDACQQECDRLNDLIGDLKDIMEGMEEME